MEAEFENRRHYMQTEMGRTRDDLEKMKDKFRRLDPPSVFVCVLHPVCMSLSLSLPLTHCLSQIPYGCVSSVALPYSVTHYRPDKLTQPPVAVGWLSPSGCVLTVSPLCLGLLSPISNVQQTPNSLYLFLMTVIKAEKVMSAWIC